MGYLMTVSDNDTKFLSRFWKELHKVSEPNVISTRLTTPNPMDKWRELIRFYKTCLEPAF